MRLNGFETGTRCRCIGVVGIPDASVKAAFLPGLLFAAQITLDPWNGNYCPHARPGERKAPSQLLRINFLPETSESEQRETYCVRDGLRDGKDDGSNGGGANDGAAGPEAIHHKEHPPEIGARQVSSPEGIAVYLATTAVYGDDVFNQNIQSGRHNGAFWGGGNSEGSPETAGAKDIEGQIDTAKVEHDGRQNHGDQAHCWESACQDKELVRRERGNADHMAAQESYHCRLLDIQYLARAGPLK